MPQLQFETYASQIFWLILCFLTLVIVSAKYTLPQLAALLRQRWTLIEGTRLEADKLKNEADQITGQVGEDLAAARKKSHEEIVRVSREISVRLSEEKQQVARKSKDFFKEEESHLYKKKENAMGGIQSIAESVASELVRKILKDYTHVAIEDVVAETLSKKAVNDV